jgi:cytochrome P450
MGWTQNLEPLAAAREHAYAIGIDDIDVSHWDLFRNDTLWPYFERLRQEKPVHFHADSQVGPYWSITSFEHIKLVDIDHQRFSSEPTIALTSLLQNDELPMFIAMDGPRHGEQRRDVQPVVAPPNLRVLEDTIRNNVVEILDGLPEGEVFNWVDHVSIELTTRMLAVLLDVPFEERYKLTRWSDVTTAPPKAGVYESKDERERELFECLTYFTRLRDERTGGNGSDLLTMLASGPAARSMKPIEFLGNILLLIVGGNDTTRNSISGGVLAMNQFPRQLEQLRADPGQIPNAVSEIIRWQTPLAYMRRTAKEDVELNGQRIRAGDRVVMWYVSGNRDESVFETPNALDITRRNARQHLAFGFGVHRCMGNRLAELQLRVLWEELLPRFSHIEVVAEPKRALSNFVRGYTQLPVELTRH